jgi:adenine phosphoribosyltransferase
LNPLELKKFIRDVPDFPKQGILFKDITPLLGDGAAFGHTVRFLAEAGRRAAATKVAAIESRGFIFGSAVAQNMGVGVVPVRKKGKLPHRVLTAVYQLEYGQDALEMHADGVVPGDKVLIVDDVLATGGTAEAVVRLVRQAGGEPVAAAFVIELEMLKGRGKLADFPISSLLVY